MRRILAAMLLCALLLSPRAMPVHAQQAQATGWSIAQVAQAYLGSSYYGVGECTGLVHQVFARFGIWTPLDVGSIAYSYPSVSPANIAPGDVLIFANTLVGEPGLSHVAIYVGGGYFVSADNPWWGVREHYLYDGGYWQSHFWSAVRILP